LAEKTIPDAHHVVRHCKKRLLIVEHGEVHGAFPEAFELRPATDKRLVEAYLSSIYFEFYEGTDSERMKACLAALPLTPKSADGLMKVNAGKARAEGVRRKTKIKVSHEGKKSCPSYATIRGLPIDNSNRELLSALALLVEGVTIAVSLV